MPVSCCPDCGSLDLRLPGTMDGGALGGGELMVSVCRACGYRGAPLVFDDESAYVGFAQARWTADGGAAPADPDEAGEADDEDLAGLLEAPAPRRPRATAAVMVVLAVPVLAWGGLLALAGVGALLAGHVELPSLLLGPVLVGVGVAIGRIGYRMWRGE